MLNAEVLTFREFVTHEPLPLSTIHGAVLEFLQGREDAVLFGAQAVSVREIKDKGLRLYQIRKEGNRHLVDARIVSVFRPKQVVEQVQILAPPELIASKVTSYCSRSGQPKAFTDRRDLAVLLLRFPELKVKDGEVSRSLLQIGAENDAFAFRDELVQQPIVEPEADDDWGY